MMQNLKLKKKTSEEISKITGGINLPPGFKIPFKEKMSKTMLKK